MQQALLRGDERALAVHGDGSALEDEVARVDALLPQVLEHPGGDLHVVRVGMELLAPGVEAEVDPGPAAGAVEHEDRAGVAHPGVVDRDVDHIHALAAGGACLLCLRRVGDHQHRLEGRHGVRDLGVVGLRRGEVLLPHVPAGGPGHERPLVRRPLGRHAEAHLARSLRVRPRSSCFSTTFWISLRISAGPLALTVPDWKASRQWRTLPSRASSLKWERGTESRTFASEAMSRVIFGPGTSTRNSWMSPRPRSSSSITSRSCLSAGTSAWKFAMASSIRALVSAVDISDPDSSRGRAARSDRTAAPRAPRR